MENTKLTFEVLSETHTERLVELYAVIFKKKVTPEYFAVKYGLELPNQERLSIVAKDKGNVIGFLGAIPQFFTNGTEQLRCVYAADFFIKENYRGKGVFEQLYAEMKLLAERANAVYIYAFQSDQTYKVCHKLGWVDLPTLQRFHISTLPLIAARVSKGLGLTKRSALGLKKSLKPFECDLEADVFNTKEGWKVLYDADYFSMKQYWPRQLIRIAGCTLWLKYDYRITVGFLHFGENADPDKMIRTLKKIARKHGIHEVVFHVQAKAEEANRLGEYLTAQSSFQMSYLPLKDDAIPLDEFHFNFMDGDLF